MNTQVEEITRMLPSPQPTAPSPVPQPEEQLPKSTQLPQRQSHQPPRASPSSELQRNAADTNKTEVLVFTDLDGSLLDTRGQIPACNRALLNDMMNRSIPIVFTSSKTRQEILHLQQLLGIEQAFIPENGGGIYVPAGHELNNQLRMEPWGEGFGVRIGKDYATIRTFFARLKSEFSLIGLADMELRMIMEITGLDEESIHRAKAREFSEPFICLRKVNIGELREAAGCHGLTVIHGGRFLHLMSSVQSKGDAVEKAIQLFSMAQQKRPFTIALGDAENDISMLQVVDQPVLLRKDDGSVPQLDLPDLRRARESGCKGWCEQLSRLIEDLPQSRRSQIA